MKMIVVARLGSVLAVLAGALLLLAAVAAVAAAAPRLLAGVTLAIAAFGYVAGVLHRREPRRW